MKQTQPESTVDPHDGDRLLSKRKPKPRSPQPQRIEPVQLAKPGNDPTTVGQDVQTVGKHPKRWNITPTF